MQLDPIDLRILAQLQEDSSLTNVELARRVHLSPSPCLARVKALEASGVIQRYVALADPKALGLGLSVFISISLKEQSKAALAEFGGEIVAVNARYVDPEHDFLAAEIDFDLQTAFELQDQGLCTIEEVRYRRPLDEVIAHQDPHRAYLRELKAQGTLLAAGPRKEVSTGNPSNARACSSNSF